MSLISGIAHLSSIVPPTLSNKFKHLRLHLEYGLDKKKAWTKRDRVTFYYLFLELI
jgi:hypothetical protein